MTVPWIFDDIVIVSHIPSIQTNLFQDRGALCLMLGCGTKDHGTGVFWDRSHPTNDLDLHVKNVELHHLTISFCIIFYAIKDLNKYAK